MPREMIEILILAAVAGFVVFRLYAVLGRRTGSERPSAPAQRPTSPVAQSHRTGVATPAPGPVAAPGPAPVGAPGVDEIRTADPSFDPAGFLTGARAAYEMIVQAFATGDRETLKSLLTPRVYETYAAALDQREQEGGQGPELVRLRNAEIVDAGLYGQDARVSVRFEAELAEGAAGIRETRERWTFERNVRSRDPNWFLAGVAQA